MLERLTFKRILNLWLSVAIFASSMPLHSALAATPAGVATEILNTSTKYEIEDTAWESHATTTSTSQATASRAPASVTTFKDGTVHSKGVKAEYVLASACRDPQHVRYSPRKKVNGAYVYFRYLKRENGTVFDCQSVGVGPITQKLAATEAGVCTNCETSKSDSNKSSIENILNGLNVAGTATGGPQCKPDKSKGFPFLTGLQCYNNVIKGVISALVDMIKGIGYLAKGAFNWTKNTFFGSKDVHKTDNAMSKVLKFFQSMPKGNFLKIAKDVGGWIKKMAIAFANNIYETARDTASCEKWKPLPKTNIRLPLAVGCEVQGNGWDCMSPNQKIQTVCAMVGSLGSDIVLMFVGGVGVAKLAGKVGKLASVMEKAGEVGAAAARTAAKIAARSTAVRVTGQVLAVTATASGDVTMFTGKMVLKALGQIDRLPGFKQYAHLQEKAFLAGLEAGGAGATKTVTSVARAGKITENLNESSRAVHDSDLALASAAPPPGNIHPIQSIEQVKSRVRKQPDYHVEKIMPDEFVKHNSERTVVPEQENEAFRYLMENPTEGGRTVVIRDINKKNNNTNLSFNRSTAITTTLIDRASSKFEKLATKYKDDLVITRFEGPNRLEVRVDPRPGKKLPATIETELADIYKTTAVEQHDFLKENNLVRDAKIEGGKVLREGDEPIEWFKYGSGPDSHTANLAARSNREYDNQLATFRWEDKKTQAQLETVFMRAQELHKSIQKQYRGTETLLADGRINPKVTDLVSKSDTPEEVIEKLKNYDVLKTDLHGKPISHNDQIKRARELMEYVDYSRSFSVEYYGPRTPLTLKIENTTCFGSDLCGQNGRNLSHNTRIFDGNFNGVVDGSANAEKTSTVEFDRMLNDTKTARTDVLERAGYKVETVSSGDDISTAVRNQDGTPVLELPPEVLYKLTTCTHGVACLRDTYVPAQVKTIVDGKPAILPKQDVIDITHELEKKLRLRLAKKTKDYDKMNFQVRVDDDGKMSLAVSQPEKALWGDELEKQYNLSVRAKDEFADLVNGWPSSELRGLSAKRVAGPMSSKIPENQTAFAKKLTTEIHDSSRTRVPKDAAEVWGQRLEILPNSNPKITGLNELLKNNDLTLVHAESRAADGSVKTITGRDNKYLFVPDEAMASDKAMLEFLEKETVDMRMSTQDLMAGPKNMLDQAYEKHGIVPYEIRVEKYDGLSHSNNLIGINPTSAERMGGVTSHEITHNTTDKNLNKILNEKPLMDPKTKPEEYKKWQDGIDERRIELSGRAMQFKTEGNFDLHKVYEKEFRADELEARMRQFGYERSRGLDTDHTAGELRQFLTIQKEQLRQASVHFPNVKVEMRNGIAYVEDPVSGLELEIRGVKGSTPAEQRRYVKDVIDKRYRFLKKYEKELDKKVYRENQIPRDRHVLEDEDYVIPVSDPNKVPPKKTEANETGPATATPSRSAPSPVPSTSSYTLSGVRSSADPTIMTIKKSDVLTLKKKVSETSSRELTQIIDKQFDDEIKAMKDKGLAGIGSHPGRNVRDFLDDMSHLVTKEERAEQIKHLDQELQELMLDGFVPYSQEALSNHLGNSMMGLHEDLKKPSFKAKTYTPELSPAHRMEKYVYFREVAKRLKKSPRAFFKEIGADYPKDDASLKRAINRLYDIFNKTESMKKP